MEEIVSLTKLNKFLYETLVFTEGVKNILKLNCNEATFSLKPWYRDTITKQKASTTDCTCSKSETEVEEITMRISRMLFQTQQLREKSCNNIKKEKRLKQTKIHQIYKTQTTGGKQKSRIKGANVNSEELSTARKLNAIKLVNEDKSFNKLQTQSIESDADSNVNKRRSSDSKRSTKCKVKSIENKNFIAMNKQNVKKTKAISKHKNANCRAEQNPISNSYMKKTGYVELDKSASAMSTSELKSLIQKMSSKSKNCDLFFNEDTSKCPSHGSLEFSYEQSSITMDVVSCLNGFNIPGEVIKPLKAYYTYMNIEFLDNSYISGKRQKVCNKFLAEFNKLNKITQECLITRMDIANILTNYISLFKNLFSKDINLIDLIDIKKAYSMLNVTWKMYDIKEFNVSKILTLNMGKPIAYNIDIRGWMSNGIWNFPCIKDLNEMSRLNYIRYIDKNQLVLFFQTIQQLQQAVYFNSLIVIILDDILPNIKLLFDHTKSEYINAYKMICILYQGLHPKIPVLVKTNM